MQKTENKRLLATAISSHVIRSMPESVESKQHHHHHELHPPPPACGEAVCAAITAQFFEWHHKFAHLITDWSDFYTPNTLAYEKRMLDELTENGSSDIFSEDATFPNQGIPGSDGNATSAAPQVLFWFPSARSPNTFLFARTVVVPVDSGLQQTFFVTKFGPKTPLLWFATEEELLKFVSLAEDIDTQRYLLLRLTRPDNFVFSGQN